jgi:hypothetical protein
MQKVADKDAFSGEVREQLNDIGAADIVLGIPTLDNRDTVACVAEAGAVALSRFSSVRSVVIEADGGSKDSTPEHLRETIAGRVPLVQSRYPLYPVHRMSATLAGVPGRREAAFTILQAARQLGAKVCVLVDAELEGIGPEWIERLIGPVLEGHADLLVPCYRRHKFDGMINLGLLSPFIRALYGKRIRQPAGADLAFSARLIELYTDQERTHSEPPDPWTTVPAIVQKCTIGQTFLGPRTVRSRQVTPEVSETLRQVLGAMFEQMEGTAAFWQKIRGSEPVPWFGPPLEIDPESPEPPAKHMIESFRLGCQDLMEVWNIVLPPATLLEVRKAARRPDAEFSFPDELWVRTVYDFALGYHFRVMGRDHLLRAITPLYLGWVASLVTGMQSAGVEETESRLERLALDFEAQKRYLISRWRSPDRFNP